MIPTLDKQIEFLKKVGELPEDEIDLAEAALMLGSLDRPGVSLQKYHHHLEILKLDTANEGHKANTATERAQALISVMWDIHEYKGDNKFYDDLQNANLMSVIDRRKGLPISLGILYMHAAASQGWRAEGVNFPAHFLIRIYGENDQVILDPFHKGKVLDAHDLRELVGTISGGTNKLEQWHHAQLERRAILVRLLNNIKIRCLNVSDFDLAMNALRRTLYIDPHNLTHKLELGMLQIHTRSLEDGKKNLLDCLDYMDDNMDAEDADMRKLILGTLKEMRAQNRPNVFELIKGDIDKGIE
ncbi:MAG: transglutaminase-like domain-containing protein [Emcibacteraceae bacterium]|nr:transglutaminase-like domain-containing protein [Emcibacteraceae bacterium]MDG1996328.1 transglutaminase-like domain-containing protein [Emcibacteraceae bacterium]